MHRGKPFFVPQPGHKETEKKKKKKKPRTWLNMAYIRSMAPITEPPQPKAAVAVKHKHKCATLKQRALKEANSRIMESGKVKPFEHNYIRMIVGELAEAMGKVDFDGSREGALGCMISIALHYASPLAVLASFTNSYNAIARVENMAREGRKVPVCPGRERDEERLMMAFYTFHSLEALDALLECVKAESKNGTSAYEIEFVSPEIIRRIAGDTKQDTGWGKVLE